MKRPRVLQLLPDLSLGGGQVVVLRHLRLMVQRGLEPALAYAGSVRDMEAEFSAAGIEPVGLGFERKRDAPRAALRLHRLIRERGIDIVHTHGTYVDKLLGHTTSTSARVRHVTTLHGNPPFHESWRREGRPRLRHRARARVLFGLDWWLNRRTLRGVVAVSDAVLAEWQPVLERAKLPGRAPIEVIHSGIPFHEYGALPPEAVAAVRREIDPTGTGPVVSVVSRLAPAKNVGVAIDAMKWLVEDHPGATLLIVGDGPERGPLEQRAGELGLSGHVAFLGWRSDVPGILQASDVVVFPSSSEGFGLVALEALASGVPAVCFPLPSLARLARDAESLVTVSDTTPDALASTVSRVLRDPNGAERGRRSREGLRARWSIEASTDAYEAFYERVVAGN